MCVKEKKRKTHNMILIVCNERKRTFIRKDFVDPTNDERIVSFSEPCYTILWTRGGKQPG